MQTGYGFHPGMSTKVRSLDAEFEVCIHSAEVKARSRDQASMIRMRKKGASDLMHSQVGSYAQASWQAKGNTQVQFAGRRDSDQAENSLMHYGVKGQKWGVITKEYEPVSVDRRKTGIAGNIRNRLQVQRAELNAERERTRQGLQAQREKRQRALKVAGTSIAAATLLLAAYHGYKVSGIKMGTAGKHALQSLTALKPHKRSLGRMIGKGFELGMAQERKNGPHGLAMVGQTFKRAGNILTGQRYREKIQKAKSYIDKAKSFGMSEIEKYRRRG